MSTYGSARQVVLRAARRTALAWVAFSGIAAAQSSIPIANIHAQIGTLTGTKVTVEGWVTIPINYRDPNTYSGYIQDESGRGINLFGGTTPVPNAFALNTVGNRVRVTGEVQVFSNTTVELANISSVEDLSGDRIVPPIQLSTAGANDARWEGTLIEVTGAIDSISAVVGGARNHYINDGSGRTVARVYTGLGAGPFTVGQTVRARGAGTNFNGLYEFYVGQASDIQVVTPGPDTQPPVLVGSWAASATSVRVTFGEAVDPTTGGTPANYQVFETATPANTVAVSSATVSGPVVTLALGASLVAGRSYSVQVTAVADTDGNPLTAPVTTVFPAPAGSGDTTPPTLSSATALTLSSVRATFSEAIDPTSGGAVANYSVFPTANPGSLVTISSVTVSGATATLALGSALTGGTNYTLRAQNVTDLATNPMPAPQTATFTPSGGPGVTPIADIQNNISTYLDQVVTIEGQVYIPSNYRGATISGYIQDGSGRGINLFGAGANVPALQDVSNIVRVTGTVAQFFTTNEILDITQVTLVSGGNPPLQPTALSTGAAANTQWEGTFIQVNGPITAKTPTGTTGVNYTVNDGSGNVLVRVVSTLGVTEFNVGQTITGRGAGSQFQADFQVLVGRAADVFVGGGTDTTPPSLTSATAVSLTSVRANFSEAIGAASGGTVANYSVFPTANPGSPVTISSAAVSGTTSTLTIGAALTAGTNYTLRAQAIADLAGNTMPAAQTATFTPTAGPAVTPIADIQNNVTAYLDQVVTIEGQVYIPSNYRGATISGYIQDGSGRGINLFGAGANVPALQDVSNIVRVTGTVAQFFTTNEILDITQVTLVSGGNPPLQPTALSTGAAANPQWEGTFIQVTGPITAKTPTGTTGVNYTVNDGSGNVLVRVVSPLGVAEFNVGQTITGRGAGSQFQADFQVLVGRAADVFVGGGTDTTPPNLTSATAVSLTSVRASFNEAIAAASGGTVANYSVFPTANPGSPVTITAAAVSGTTATLTLAAPLPAGTNYTLRAQTIADLAGNTMPAAQTATFTPTAGPAVTPIADIQNNITAYLDQVVTIEGQVYIPSNYRGATISGYIQDGSGRGINVFGAGANVPALQDVSNIVRVTGTVAQFFTTNEILDITQVTLVSGGNPPLQPTALSTGAAANSQWEGTFIQVTGPITAKTPTGTTGVNYTVNDGSGNVLVRVVSTLSAADFNVGQTITGRGAGSQFQADFQVLVGRAADVFVGGGTDTTPPSLTSATAVSLTSVRASFNEAIAAASGGTVANYSVFPTANPGSPVTINAAAVSGTTATLTLASPLTEGTNYTLRAQAIADLAGNTMPAAQTRTFTPSSGAGVTPIADIQNNLRQFKGQPVTIEGQIYIPTNYRGATTSGYIQDGSGRGINLFGSTANLPVLQNVGNIVRVSGVVDTFFTTTEIVNITNATLVSGGNPPLQPTVLRTGDAASRAWEGTYILVTGTVTSKTTTGNPPTAFNYTLDDGSGPVLARVVSTIAAPEFNVNDRITAQGAGSQFNADFQILVGASNAIFLGEPVDTFPPAVVRALAGGGTTMTVDFNEPVTAATAEVASNYEVFRTSNPGETIAVQGAQLVESTKVQLTLASALDPALGYTVRVRNVADGLGNTIPAGGTTRGIEVAPAEEVSLAGPPFTFLPRQGETYPLTFTVPSDIASGGGEVLLRIFDVNGRLKRTLFDSRFDQGSFTNNRATRLWDGRDDTQSVVPAGTYVVHLQVSPERSDRERQQVQIPVVVATRLER